MLLGDGRKETKGCANNGTKKRKGGRKGPEKKVLEGACFKTKRKKDGLKVIID